MISVPVTGALIVASCMYKQHDALFISGLFKQP